MICAREDVLAAMSRTYESATVLSYAGVSDRKAVPRRSTLVLAGVAVGHRGVMLRIGVPTGGKSSVYL